MSTLDLHERPINDLCRWLHLPFSANQVQGIVNSSNWLIEETEKLQKFTGASYKKARNVLSRVKEYGIDPVLGFFKRKWKRINILDFVHQIYVILRRRLVVDC